MSLIIASGSNLGDSTQNLLSAKQVLCRKFDLIAESRIYRSSAVDYENQPDFFNQVLEFAIPELPPELVMQYLLKLELKMGRTRDILRGPRSIDLDIIFWGKHSIQMKDLEVPHPRWRERSFVVRPLKELPFFQTIEKWFTIPESFKVEAVPV